MPCPFLQPVSNDMKNGIDNESDNDSIIDGPAIPTTSTVNGVNNHDEVVEEPLTYTSYLGLDILLSALKCLSHTDPADSTTPYVHDEHFFILIHQVFELWFKQILFEIDSIRSIFSNNDDITYFFFDINSRLNRINKIWTMLIDQMQLLELMTPMAFLEFRNYITPASGFQSLQFRIIEIVLGLTDKFRSSYKTEYFTGTMFKGKQSNELKKAVQEVSLLCLIERWLEKIYDDSRLNFCNIYASAVDRMINHEKEEKIMNGTDEETAERNAQTAKRQFAKMIDPNEYEALLKNKERRISQKAMFAASMIAHYHEEPCFQQPYQILSSLMDMDALMSSWRHQHVLLVQRQIGRKPGTGGTDGFTYLHQTISDKYQVFSDLFNISSYQIPQRFLPKFVNKFTISATKISSLILQPHREVPIIRKQQSCLPKYQPIQNPTQYYQIPFHLLLFVVGCLFAVFVGRFAR